MVTSFFYYDIHDGTAILQSLGFKLATSSSLGLVGTPRCQFWISMSKKRQTLNCRPHLVCTKNHQSSHDSYSIWNKAHSMIGGSIVVLVSGDPVTESLWYKRDSVLPKNAATASQKFSKLLSFSTDFKSRILTLYLSGAWSSDILSSTLESPILITPLPWCF